MKSEPFKQAWTWWEEVATYIKKEISVRLFKLASVVVYVDKIGIVVFGA